MALAPAPLRILLVEDNLPDIRLTTEALKDGDSPSTLSVARDGVEALALLQHDPATRHPLPDLILLDLNLPRKDGREVLRAVKSNPDLVHIPIIILTTSAAEQDVRDSYRLGANAYVIKPVDLDRFFAIMTAIQRFWMHTVRLTSSAGRHT